MGKGEKRSGLAFHPSDHGTEWFARAAGRTTIFCCVGSTIGALIYIKKFLQILGALVGGPALVQHGPLSYLTALVGIVTLVAGGSFGLAMSLSLGLWWEGPSNRETITYKSWDFLNISNDASKMDIPAQNYRDFMFKTKKRTRNSSSIALLGLLTIFYCYLGIEGFIPNIFSVAAAYGAHTELSRTLWSFDAVVSSAETLITTMLCCFYCPLIGLLAPVEESSPAQNTLSAPYILLSLLVSGILTPTTDLVLQIGFSVLFSVLFLGISSTKLSMFFLTKQ